MLHGIKSFLVFVFSIFSLRASSRNKEKAAKTVLNIAMEDAMHTELRAHAMLHIAEASC